MGDLIDARHRFGKIPKDGVSDLLDILFGPTPLMKRPVEPELALPDLDWRMEYDRLWKRYVELEDENAALAATVALLEDEILALEAELEGDDL